MLHVEGFRSETRTAPDIVVGKLRLTPRSRTTTLRLPRAVLVWARPMDIVVYDEAEVRRLRMMNTTSLLQIALWGCAVAVWLAVRFRRIERKETQK